MARGGGDQDIALLALIAIVAVVGIVGLFVSSSLEGSDALTGNVVASDASCDSCRGYPVCAAKGQTVYTYPNACEAECDGAKVIHADSCEALSTR